MASFSVVEFLGSTKPLYISSSALVSLITRTHHDVRFLTTRRLFQDKLTKHTIA